MFYLAAENELMLIRDPQVPDLSTITAILFDMDGVLMLSNDLHSAAYQLAFEAENIHDFSHTEISGMRTDEVVHQVLKRNQRTTSDAEVARVTAEKRAHAKRLFKTQVPVIDGCLELLKTLHQHYSIALATSASPNTANAFLDANNNRAHFDFVITGPEVTLSKPHPEIYQRAMQAFGATPQQCLVIEDSVNGVASGRDAGAHVVGVEGTFAPETLLKEGAFTVIPSAAALPGLLGH